MPSANSTAINGTQAIANRVSSTDWISGNRSNHCHGSPVPVSVLPMCNVDPNDSTLSTTIVTAAARTTRLRHNQNAAAATRTSSGQPKYAFCSVGLIATFWPGANTPPRDSDGNCANDLRSLPIGPWSINR